MLLKIKKQRMTLKFSFMLISSITCYNATVALIFENILCLLSGLQIPAKIMQSYSSLFMLYDVPDEMWDIRSVGCLGYGIFRMWMFSM